MAKGENITTKFSVDISELKANIQEANRQIKLANSEFKAASSGMDDWSKSADGLSAKIGQLTKVEEAELKKLDALKKQYALVAEEQGENSTAAQNLMIKINNQQAAVNKTQASIKQYTSQLDTMQSSTNDVRTASQQLSDEINDQEKELSQLKTEYKDVILAQGENSDEARQLASQISSLNSDLQANKNKMKEVDGAADKLTQSLDETGDSAEDSSDGFTIMKGALADLTANAITGAISKMGEFVGALFDMSEATEEYRSMQAKLEGAAKRAGYEAEYAANLYKLFYKYVGDDQMATNAVTNLLGIGASQETLNDLVGSAIDVWATYGDSIPIESLTEAINETIQVGKVTGTFADTINWVKISNNDMAKSLGNGTKAQKAFNKAIKEGETQEDAFSAALAATSDQHERANIVASFLNATYEETGYVYDDLTGSMQEAKLAEVELKETQAKLGEAIEPVNSAITNLKNKALKAILPVVEKVADKFLDFNEYLKENPKVAKAITAGVTALATAFVTLAGALAIQALINGVTKAFALLNTTMLANPFVLVAAAIAGLVAGFIYLWNTSEEFRNFWIGLWDSIVSFVGGAADSIVNFFTETIPNAFDSFVSFFKNMTNTVQKFFSNMWNGIINFFTSTIPSWIDNVIQFFQKIPYYLGYMVGAAIGTFAKWGVNLWNFATKDIPKFISEVIKWFSQLPGKIWTWLVNAFTKVVTWGSNMISKAKSVASQFVSSVINYVSQLPSRIWSWLSSAASKVVSWGYDLAKKGASAAKKLFDSVVNGVKSLPSRMTSIGKNIVQGIWNGITGMGNWLMKKIRGFADGIVDGIKDFFDIHSPSRRFRDEVGKMLPKGLVVGVESQFGNVKKAMRNLGTKTMGYANRFLSPVKTNLSSMTSRLSDSIQSKTKALKLSASDNGGKGDVIFNQYNSSPKALSRLDLYRQTKTQLINAKGKLKYV